MSVEVSMYLILWILLHFSWFSQFISIYLSINLSLHDANSGSFFWTSFNFFVNWPFFSIIYMNICVQFQWLPQNEENLRISRIAVYHCICTAPYMIRKGGRISRTLVGPHSAIYMSSAATLLMSIFLPNFALSHQDSYKSGRTPFRPLLPALEFRKIYTHAFPWVQTACP